MSGFLVIGTSDITQYYESIDNAEFETKVHFNLEDKEDINKINNNKISVILNLGNRHSIISYEGTNYIQVRLDKPIN